MDGVQLVNILNRILKERGISKGEFCKAIGVSANTYSNWANGTEPKLSRIKAIENYLGISLSDYEEGKEPMLTREDLLNDPDMRMLFDVAQGAPSSVFHEAAALFLRWKEESQNK